MALKDWKKILDRTWENKKDNIIIVWNKIGDYYTISIIEDGGKGRVLLHKHFRTKPQALRFAKEYMRTH